MSTFKQFIFSTVSADVEFDTLGSQNFVHPVVDYDLTNDFTIEEIINDVSIISMLNGGNITAKDENDRGITELNVKAVVSKKIYDAIVDASGNGDYSNLSSAFASGFVQSIFVRNGIYAESNDIVIPDGGSIIGESINGVSIVFTGAKGIIADSAASKEIVGTISISNGATTVVGIGTTFTNLSSGDYILIGNTFYEINSVTDDLNLDLLETYNGVTISDSSYIAQSMFTNISIKDFNVFGDITSNTIDFTGTKDSEISNIRSFAAKDQNGISITDSGSIKIRNVVSQNNAINGLLLDGCYSVDILSSNFSNNVSAGITSANANNNIVIDGCNIEANENGIVMLTGGYDIRIVNNKVSNNSLEGVNVDSDRTVILSNSVTSNGTNGIVISASSNGTTIGFNDVYGNAGTDFIDLGTGTAIANVAPINTKTVNIKEDFPAEIGGIITLADNTIYRVHGNVSIGTDRILYGVNSKIIGNNRGLDKITYTGSGDMFTASSNSLHVGHIEIICSLGAVFNFDGGGSNDFNLEYCTMSGVDDLGVIGNYRTSTIVGCSIQNAISGGFTITGITNGIFTMYDTAVANNTGISFDFGTSIQDNIDISRNIFNALVTQTIISSSAPDTAVNNNGLFTNNSFTGVGTYTTGITKNTSNWRFLGNVGVGDSSNAKTETNTTNGAVTFAHTIALPDDNTQYLFKAIISAMSDDQTHFGTWIKMISATKIGGATVVQKVESVHTEATGLKAFDVSSMEVGGNVVITVQGVAAKNIKWITEYNELTKSINP